MNQCRQRRKDESPGNPAGSSLLLSLKPSSDVWTHLLRSDPQQDTERLPGCPGGTQLDGPGMQWEFPNIK